MQFVKAHFLAVTIIPLLILTTAASYYRFMVLEDYFVVYEVECDPAEQSCYIGCEDEECTEEYYYALIERRANEIHSLCGESVLNCEASYECQPDVAICSFLYCEPGQDFAECIGPNEETL